MTWLCQYANCEVGGEGSAPILLTIRADYSRRAFCGVEHLAAWVQEALRRERGSS